MRKSFALALGLVMVSAMLAAQGHNNFREKKASDLIMVLSDVRIGTVVLKAGDYRVVCDTKKISFIRIRDNRTALEATCKGQEMKAESATTILFTAEDKDGVRYVQKLHLRGSNVEHVFD